jgi:glycosyltransferase involved in cell wall biosynthesis
MRFLIGCHEICGLIKVYSEELQKKGHSVISIADVHPFYNYTYSYPDSTLSYNFFTKEKWPTVILKGFFRFSELIEKKYPDFRRLIILYLLRKKFDVYIHIWKGLVNEQTLFRVLKKYNKKIIVLFLGDDVRHFSAFSQEFDLSFWKFPETYSKKPILPALEKLRYAEKYADVVYSVPDQMGLAIKPYKHLHIPVDIKNFNFVNNQRKVPKVLHLPSEPFIKGSDRIMAVLNELKEEGLDFEIIYKSKIPFEEVKKTLEEVDILADELITHGPGVLAFEAMASGCAVATNYLEEYKDVFGPPVCVIKTTNIKEQLKKLISDYDYRQQLIDNGYEYVKSKNNVSAIVDGMLNDLSFKDIKMDYFPSFYGTKYKNKSDEQLLEKMDKVLA